MFKSNILYRLWFLALLAVLLPSCSQDYLEPAPVRQSDDFVMTLGGSLTRAVNANTVLGDMQFYYFSNRVTTSISGGRGSW